jgi:hypothetical protein
MSIVHTYCLPLAEAFHRARAGPKGEWLTRQGMAISEPMTQAALKDADRNM